MTINAAQQQLLKTLALAIQRFEPKSQTLVLSLSSTLQSLQPLTWLRSKQIKIYCWVLKQSEIGCQNTKL